MVTAALTTARNVVGVIGNIIALCLFLSPVPTFIRIIKKGRVEEYSAIPYLATLVNCMVWVLYGQPMVRPHSILVVTINGAGTVLELIYTVLFFIYCGSRRKRAAVAAALVIEILFVAILTVLVLSLLDSTAKRSMAVGIVGILFSIMMYASPLAVMKRVIRTRSVEYMPFYLSLASFCNGVTWTAYALMPFDLFIAVPNGLGSVFALAQLILYGAYYKSSKKIMAERQQPGGDLNLSEVVLSKISDEIPEGPAANGS